MSSSRTGLVLTLNFIRMRIGYTIRYFAKLMLVSDMKYSPDKFAARAATLDDPDLARWWSVAVFSDGIDGTSERLASAGCVALTHWSSLPFTGLMSLEMHGVQGATNAVARCILDNEHRSYQLTRQLGTYFHSQNIGVAFCAIRQFDVHTLSSHTMFVIDQLVNVASAPELPLSPSPMSLRAIAFKVLFDLDQNFRTWPQLAKAYEECIAGCRAWGLDGRQAYQVALRNLLQYRTVEK